MFIQIHILIVCCFQCSYDDFFCFMFVFSRHLLTVNKSKISLKFMSIIPSNYYNWRRVEPTRDVRNSEGIKGSTCQVTEEL